MNELNKELYNFISGKDKNKNKDINYFKKKYHNLNQITIVGVVSLYYYEDLDVGDGTKRNILLLGDVHSLNTQNTCIDISHITRRIDEIDINNKETFEIKNKSLNKLLDSNINNNCMTLYHFIRLLINKNIFIDYYDETFINKKGDKSYIGYISKYIDINNNNNIRHHKGNIRSYFLHEKYNENCENNSSNLNNYKSDYISSISPNIYINFNSHINYKLIYYYILYLFEQITKYKILYLNINIDEKYKIKDITDEINNINSKIIKSGNIDNINKLTVYEYENAINFLIIKQFKKSIFYNNTNKFVNTILNVYFKSKIKFIYLEYDNICTTLENFRMDIYMLCRMFKSYPKNIISFTGNYHTLFFKEFINNYFEKKETINHDDVNNISSTSNINRSIKIPFLPFIEKSIY